jgi:hypothetical protein
LAARDLRWRIGQGRPTDSVLSTTKITKVLDPTFSPLDMASIASRSASALRAASRRAPRAGAKIAVKPAQSASYSLLARQALAGTSRKPALQVKKNY